MWQKNETLVAVKVSEMSFIASVRVAVCFM